MPPVLPKSLYFTKGLRKYKYTAHLPNGKKVHFGHRDYEHYKDLVPINKGGGLWSSSNHLDSRRRKNYRLRHSKVMLKDGTPAYKKRYTPAWFSYYFLW